VTPAQKKTRLTVIYCATMSTAVTIKYNQFRQY
jgi:hypothetical protein